MRCDRAIRNDDGRMAARNSSTSTPVAITVNSYSRLIPGFWAPTSATWGVENRTTALRVIPGGLGE